MTVKIFSKLRSLSVDSRVFRRYISTSTELYGLLHRDEKEGDNLGSLEKLKNETLAEIAAYRTPIALPDFQILYKNGNNFDRLKTICFELRSMKLRGEQVPNTISLHWWIRLLALDDIALLRKYVAYLVYVEKKRCLFAELRKAAVPKHVAAWPKKKPSHAGRIAIFVYEESIEKLKNFKLFEASMFGTHLLIDCCYETIIPARDIYFCAEFIERLWRKNRKFRDPFHLVFCNFDEKGALMMELRRRIRNLDKEDFPFYSTSLNYLEIYPKEKLVYLTPHCTEVLNNYSPEDIYIIGNLDLIVIFTRIFGFMMVYSNNHFSKLVFTKPQKS